ncbi:hypothetical protein L2D00_14670 [Hyphomonadaceae bacterium BL14]|nr:hypothetical protein L2D00_14670 [Hyphomonadaceae bacterium BL14]
MKQSRAMSMIEALANVAVGCGVAVLTQIAVFPLFGLSVTLTQNQNLMMVGLFTLVSFIRSYALRGVFERFRATGRCGGHGVHAGPAQPPE